MKSKIVIEGQKFYDEHLKAILEPEHIGEFVSIELESNQHFLGKTGGQAIAEGNKISPNKILFLIRIGYDSAYKFGGFHKIRNCQDLIWCCELLDII